MKRVLDNTSLCRLPILGTVFIRKNDKSRIFQLKSIQWEVCSLVTDNTILRISPGVKLFILAQ